MSTTTSDALFPWLLRGVDFDNDSAFMNDVVVPWCREQKLEVTRSRAYKKNDQAFVEQKNGAVVRRLMGYGRFDGVETARVMARLYAAARLYVNFFQPSFKLKEKRREGAKVIKRYHPPSTPCERALAHPKVAAAVKTRLREQYRTLDPVALLAEIRVSVAHELSGLGSTRVVRFCASEWRRIDEPGDVATGPENAEISGRFEPLGTAGAVDDGGRGAFGNVGAPVPPLPGSV